MAPQDLPGYWHCWYWLYHDHHSGHHWGSNTASHLPRGRRAKSLKAPPVRLEPGTNNPGSFLLVRFGIPRESPRKDRARTNGGGEDAPAHGARKCTKSGTGWP